LIINFLAYPALVEIIATSTSAFRTSDSSSTYHLWFDPKVIFFKDSHLPIWIFVTLPGIVFLVVGIPYWAYRDSKD